MDDKKVYEVTVHRCMGILVRANDENEAKALAVEAANDTYLEDWDCAETKVLYEPKEIDIDYLSDEVVNEIYPN